MRKDADPRDETIATFRPGGLLLKGGAHSLLIASSAGICTALLAG